jgi:hypothetical protein
MGSYMKTRDIAKKYQLDLGDFDRWLKQSSFQFKSGITGLSVDDGVNADEMVGHFNQYRIQEKARVAEEQERLALEQANAEQAELAKQQATASPSTRATFPATMRYRWTAQPTGLGV